MDRSRIAIVIPALNESASIAAVVERAARHGVPIVVDDGSTDGTAELARAAGAEVVRLERNCGYDWALENGFRHASSLNLEFIITMDADGQHDADLIDQFAAEFERGADVVIGIRDRRQRLSEHLFAWVALWIWGVRDPLCGMKGYATSVYRRLGHFDSYGSIGTELALFGVRNGFRVVQVPVPTRSRAGSPRFGRLIAANWRILRALMLAFAPPRACPSLPPRRPHDAP